MDQKTSISMVRTIGGGVFLNPDWVSMSATGGLMLGWKGKTEVAIVNANRVDCLMFAVETPEEAEAMFEAAVKPEVDDGSK